VAARFEEYAGLRPDDADVTPVAREVMARWNDGRFVKLHRGDGAFLAELLAQLRGQLEALATVPRVIAAIHHLPFRELLPPPRINAWDFAKAYLGSGKIGEVLLDFANVREVLCGHSHLPGEMEVGRVRATNIGSGYRWKRWVTLDLE
jgi:hypothetical protein